MTRWLVLLAIAACTPAAPVPPVPVSAPPVSEQQKPILRSTVPYLDEIRDAVQFYYGVPPPLPVFVGQVEQESRFNAKAKSPVGAQGLLQLMPSTATWIAAQGGFGIAAPFDPKWNLQAGIWYNRWLFDRVKPFDSNCDRFLLGFSDYNGGSKWRMKRQALSKSPGNWALTGNINPGITEASQRENYSYGPRIVYALQPKYATLGPLVCKGGA